MIDSSRFPARVSAEAAVLQGRQPREQQPARLGLVAGEGERALQDVAGREHAELIAELARAAAVVEHRDDGVDAQPGVLLQAAEQARQARPAPETADVDRPQSHGTDCRTPVPGLPPRPRRRRRKPGRRSAPAPSGRFGPTCRYTVGMARGAWHLGGAVGFGLLVLLNVGGYRYGVSDQAFYVPVVLQQIDPRLFPHDAALLDAQNRFLAFDDWFAALIVLTGASVSSAFLLAYLGGLATLYASAAAMGRSLYRTGWGTAALVAALAIRHRIPDTAVNTLESYLHPRQLAFAVGLAAVAVFLRRGRWSVIAAVAAAALFHPTTALWFALLLGPALLVADRDAPRPAAGGGRRRHRRRRRRRRNRRGDGRDGPAVDHAARGPRTTCSPPTGPC